MIDTLSADLRYAARRLFASPGFTLAAVLCIAVGITANTVIFSLANALLLRPVAGVADPDALLEIGRTQNGSGSDTFGYPTIQALQDGSDTVDVAGWTFLPLAIGGGEVSEAVMGALVTGNYFDVIEAPLQLGRGFAPEESGPSAGVAVVVISDALWRGRFDGDPGVVGTQVVVNGTPATIVGVAGPGFGGTVGVARVGAWVPFGMVGGGMPDAESMGSWFNNFVLGVGRLRDGATLPMAGDELDGIMQGLVAEHPDALRGQGVAVNAASALPVSLAAPVSLFMGVLLVLVALVLAVACTNVAGMVLARSLSRGREVAVRAALGAPRRRLVQQLLTESALLASLGGAVGLAGGWAGTRLLRALELPVPPPFDITIEPVVDVRVAGFALAITVLAALLTGLGPAVRASRPDLVPALKAESGASGRFLGRRVLVVAQFGMTALLVVVAGLFLRALTQASSLDLGFDPANVYALGLDTDMTALPDPEAVQLVADLARAAASVPGVESAAATTLLPLGLPANIGYGPLSVDGVEPPPERNGYRANVNLVTRGYFETMRIPLLAGNDFAEDLRADDPPVAIINAHTAEFFWGRDAAVGQQFNLGGTEIRVVGVVGDSRYETLTEEPKFFLYLPHAQRFRAEMYVIARIEGDPAVALASIREQAAARAPDMPVLDVVSLRSYADLGLLPQRVAATVAGAMGVVVMFLAAIGIYGVTAQVTRRRTREIGVRMAIGAERADVVKLVLRQGMRGPLIGLAAGMGVAVLVTRVLEFLLFGVSPLDPGVLAGSVALLLGIAFLANWAPALWASRVDPVRALRSE